MPRKNRRNQTLRTTDDGSGGQMYSAGNSPSERNASNQRVHSTPTSQVQGSGVTGRRLGLHDAGLIAGNVYDHRGPTTSPRPQARPDVGVNRAVRRTRRKK